MYTNIVVSFSLPVLVLFIKQVFFAKTLVNNSIFFKEFFLSQETEIFIRSIFKETTGYKVGIAKRLGDNLFALAYPPVTLTRYKGIREYVSGSLDGDIILGAYG